MTKAKMILGSVVWTMSYELNEESITIHDFSPDDSDGYLLPPSLIGTLQSIIEIDGRVADAVVIDNVRYDVTNKQNVYSYRQPIGS